MDFNAQNIYTQSFNIAGILEGQNLRAMETIITPRKMIMPAICTVCQNFANENTQKGSPSWVKAKRFLMVGMQLKKPKCSRQE